MEQEGFHSIFNQDYAGDLEPEETRVVDPEIRSDDSPDAALRPLTFEHFYGQTKIKENLKIFIEAAKK